MILLDWMWQGRSVYRSSILYSRSNVNVDNEVDTLLTPMDRRSDKGKEQDGES